MIRAVCRTVDHNHASPIEQHTGTGLAVLACFPSTLASQVPDANLCCPSAISCFGKRNCKVNSDDIREPSDPQQGLVLVEILLCHAIRGEAFLETCTYPAAVNLAQPAN